MKSYIEQTIAELEKDNRLLEENDYMLGGDESVNIMMNDNQMVIDTLKKIYG